MSELKPCPFCGAEAVTREGYNPFWLVTHEEGCYFEAPGAFSKTVIPKSNEKLIQRWNTRAEE